MSFLLSLSLSLSLSLVANLTLPLFVTTPLLSVVVNPTLSLSLCHLYPFSPSRCQSLSSSRYFHRFSLFLSLYHLQRSLSFLFVPLTPLTLSCCLFFLWSLSPLFSLFITLTLSLTLLFVILTPPSCCQPPSPYFPYIPSLSSGYCHFFTLSFSALTLSLSLLCHYNSPSLSLSLFLCFSCHLPFLYCPFRFFSLSLYQSPSSSHCSLCRPLFSLSHYFSLVITLTASLSLFHFQTSFSWETSASPFS